MSYIPSTKINALQANVSCSQCSKNRKDHIRPLLAYFLRKFLPSSCDTDIRALRMPGKLEGFLVLSILAFAWIDKSLFLIQLFSLQRPHNMPALCSVPSSLFSDFRFSWEMSRLGGREERGRDHADNDSVKHLPTPNSRSFISSWSCFSQSQWLWVWARENPRLALPHLANKSTGHSITFECQKNKG